MASNGRPPPHGRDHASNSGSNGRNDTADNSNTTAPNGQASPYVPNRPPPRPPARPPTAAERAQFNNFQFPRESFDFLGRDQSRIPINRERQLSEQPSPFDASARIGDARPTPPSTEANGVVGGGGQGQGEQSAARRQSYPYGSLRPVRANMTAEDVQRLAEIRARAHAIVNAAVAGRTSIDPERRGELATRQLEEEEERRRLQDARGAWAEDVQRRAEARARAGAMVDAAIAGTTTVDSESGGERARQQRMGEEQRRRRQDAQENGAGTEVEDEHAEDKEE